MPKEIRIPIYSLTTELAKNMSVVHVFEDWAPQKDFIIVFDTLRSKLELNLNFYNGFFQVHLIVSG